MNKSITVKAKTELLSNSISAFNIATNAQEVLDAHYKSLRDAGIPPSYFATYFKKGGANNVRNEECTATKEQAEAVAADFLHHHKDRDTIIAYRALTKEDKGDMTKNELKALAQIAARVTSKQSTFRKKYANYCDKAYNSELKEAAKNDPNAAKELDDKLDNNFKAKQLKALTASAKQAKDKLSEDEYSQVNAAYKTLVAFYNS